MKNSKNNQWKKVIVTTVASATLFTPLSTLVLETHAFASEANKKENTTADSSSTLGNTDISLMNSATSDSSSISSDSSSSSSESSSDSSTNTSSSDSESSESSSSATSSSDSSVDSSATVDSQEETPDSDKTTTPTTDAPQTEENTYDPSLVRQQAVEVMGKSEEQYASFRSLRVSDQQAFINKISDFAVGHAKTYGIYASVMIAQAIVESAWGKSGLSVEPNNNLFGIKGNYNGQSAYFWTTEFVNGQYIQVYAAFRKYPSYKESLEDNAKLLRYGITGNSSFYNGTWVERTNSYRDATQWLQGRYATDPNYASTLNSIISTYNLAQYDSSNGISIKEMTNVNLKARVAVNSEKYNVPAGNLFVEKVSGTVNSTLAPRGYLTDISKKVVTNDGRVFYLSTINGSGFCWIPAENLTFYEDVQSVEKVNLAGLITSDSERYSVPDGNSRIEKFTMTTASLSSKVVQISNKLVTTSGKVYYAIRQNNKGICWLPAEKLQLSEPAGTQTNVTMAGLLKDGARKYRIAELGHVEPLDVTTDSMAVKSVKIIKKVQTASGKTYYLITNSNNQPICWIAESDLILSENVASTQGYNNGGLVKSSTRKYSMPQDRKMLNATSAFTSDLVGKQVIIADSAKTTDGKLYYLILNTNGVGIGWVDSSSIEMGSKSTSNITTLSAGGLLEKPVKKYSMNAQGYLFPTVYTTTELTGLKIRVIQTVTANDGNRYYLVANGSTPICWVKGSDLIIGEEFTGKTSVTKGALITGESKRYSIADNTNYLQPLTFNLAELVGQRVNLIQQVTTISGKKFYLVNIDGRTICWVDESVLQISSTIKTVTNYNKKATITKSMQKFTYDEKTKEMIPNNAYTSNIINQTVDVTSVATATNGTEYYLIKQNGGGIGWITKDGLNFK